MQSKFTRRVRVCPHCQRSFLSINGRLCCSRSCAAFECNARRKRTVEERFWEKVDKSGDCWPWTGSHDPRGYGHFQPVDGKSVGAHRFAYILTFGPIPPGLFVCHHCDNPICVNPVHLFLGSPKDNTQDSLRKGRLSPHTPGTFRGAASAKAKLTEAQVLEILRRGSEPLKVLAREFGVTACNIWAIRHRKSWRHLQPTA